MQLHGTGTEQIHRRVEEVDTLPRSELRFTCEAISAGGTAAEMVEIKRDATDPTVTYTGGGAYGIADEVAVTCSAQDNLSGVASDTFEDASGPAWSFPLGDHTLSATATDGAGNTGSGEVTLSVVAFYDGLCSLVELWVVHKGVANALCAKLRAAEKAEEQGNLGARDGALGAFVSDVEAQSGKKVAADVAPILIVAAESLTS